jgi:hypothetical protein
VKTHELSRRFMAYGCATVASAGETAAKLTINPKAEITNIRSMAALHRLPFNISMAAMNGK